MYSLLKKEISGFFGSLTGYLVLVVFLLVNGLFLWVFPGNYNIIDSGYAGLDGLFSLAPWVYLFLVPAVTMRLFAEEKRMGTIELLLTRPLSSAQIILAKYFSGLLLVLFSLIPALIYFYSVYMLGSPVGNIDTGGTWGSFIGLFFLAAIYVAIGLFSSSLTENQIFAFILAVVLSFLAYIGFDFIGSMNWPSVVQKTLLGLGINEHYLSISRGVVDSRDLVYFLLAIALLLIATGFCIRKHKFSWNAILRKLALPVAASLVLMFVSDQLFIRIDLTAEKRYSLSDISKTIASQLKEPVYIDLYLAGDLHPGFQKFQDEIKEKILDYNAFSSQRINLQVIDPYAIDAKERNKLFNVLEDKGLQPVDLQLKTDQGISTRYIFPGAIVHYGSKEIALNLLKNRMVSGEENLNNSIESLEYEFTNALKILMTEKRELIGFLTGQDELGEYETEDIRQSLAANFQVKRLFTEDLNDASAMPKVLVIANPQRRFEEKEKFAVDQYIMRGGRVLWLVDPVQVSLDSLQNGLSTLAFPRDLNLDDQLFRYGVRLNYDLVQDVDCMMIPVNTAPAGSSAKFTPFPWYFSPLAVPSTSSMISRNIRQVKTEFISSVDTVGRSSDIKKTILLSTTEHSRVLKTPLEVSLASVATPPDRSLFNQGRIPLGVLLEGKFTSVFKNRMVDQYGLSVSQIKTESKPTRMIVLADGNLAANKYSTRTGTPEFMPLGYDMYSKQTFGNKEFLLNAVNYLCDESGVMALRSRVFKLRLLDKVKVREQKLMWQIVNLLFPILLICLFGGLFVWLRARKYKC